MAAAEAPEASEAAEAAEVPVEALAAALEGAIETTIEAGKRKSFGNRRGQAVRKLKTTQCAKCQHIC